MVIIKATIEVIDVHNVQHLKDQDQNRVQNQGRIRDQILNLDLNLDPYLNLNHILGILTSTNHIESNLVVHGDHEA